MLDIRHYPVPPYPRGDVAVLERPVYPVPRHVSTDPLPATLPKPVTDLLAYAVRHGWVGVITHAEGNLPHATTGRPSAAVKVSDAVRLARGKRRAVAVRMDGKWESLFTFSNTEFFTRHRLLDDFRAALQLDGASDAA